MKLHEALAIIRNPECGDCKMHQEAVKICQMGHGSPRSRIMVVGRIQSSDDYQKSLSEELAAVGLEPADIYFTAAIKCRNFEQDASNTDVKKCRQYLEREIRLLKPDWVLTLGNEALLAVTGHSGIMKWRGKIETHSLPLKNGGVHQFKVYPTISLSNVHRNPGFGQGFRADLALFASEATGRGVDRTIPEYTIVDTKSKLRELIRRLGEADLISYDVETTVYDRQEHDPNARIITLSGTLVTGKQVWRFALPLFHPESPWRTVWRSVLRLIARAFGRVPKQIAHNGKFDARWLRKFGVPAQVTFDTMLAAHLLDENRQKGLKPQAMSRLGVPPWAIPTDDLLHTPLSQVLEYNMLDTWYTYLIYKQIRKELFDRPRLLDIYRHILMPANEKLIEAELRGIWVDRRRLASMRARTAEELREIEIELMYWVPEPVEDPSWPKEGRRGQLRDVNFNPSIFARWLLFDHLELPVLERGKKKDDGSPGDPSMREGVMLELKGLHPIVDVMIHRAGVVKKLQFLDAWDLLIDLDDRIHTSIKLAGTVTGRASSGKEDAEKITGARGKRRGMNLQQVPRDVEMRGLFGAAPGYMFVEVDFSQVELRVVAELAQEATMLRLFQMNEDIHTATASSVLGVPRSQVTKDHRKKAKAVNFGFVYSMGAAKFVRYAFENYEVIFTLEEGKEVRKQYFNQFSGLLPWHARQRRLVHKYARVQSPIGRVRHLPDIRSEDPYVVGEAERQAINSPVQSFASDMNFMGMVIAHTKMERKGLEAHALGTVHDATLWEVREEHVGKAIRIIKQVYENLPLEEWFGVRLSVPIVADIKVGTHWGGAAELTEEEVMAYGKG